MARCGRCGTIVEVPADACTRCGKRLAPARAEAPPVAAPLPVPAASGARSPRRLPWIVAGVLLTIVAGVGVAWVLTGEDASATAPLGSAAQDHERVLVEATAPTPSVPLAGGVVVLSRPEQILAEPVPGGGGVVRFAWAPARASDGRAAESALVANGELAPGCGWRVDVSECYLYVPPGLRVEWLVLARVGDAYATSSAPWTFAS